MNVEKKIDFKILSQPTETTCGSACLHAIYQYYGDAITLEQVISEVTHLEGGGTLAVFLACHALRRGYSAMIYTYNLNVFDPTWFGKEGFDISERLISQMSAKNDSKLRIESQGYLDFLALGGKLMLEDLTTALIRKYLKRSIPIVTGLSSTFLYRSSREVGYEGDEDDLRGEPTGHFVVLCGYNKEERTVTVADPFKLNPFSDSHHYIISIDRVLCSILLGVLTYDANFLIIWPNKAT